MDDLAFIEDPDNWPQWPLLPIKNRSSGQVGVLFDQDKSIIYLINLWAIKGVDQLKDSEKIEFESFEAMVGAGWVVD